MNKIFLIFLTYLLPWALSAQTIRGKVTNEVQAPLEKATVVWLNSRKGATTNEAGEFSIDLPKKSPYTLLISFVGYKTDTLQVTDTSFIQVSLTVQPPLSNVTVHGTKRPYYISANPIKTEVITSLELKKAACCDLAGCFAGRQHFENFKFPVRQKFMRIADIF